MKNRAIGALLAGALAVLLTAWFLATHDRAPRREWVGPTGEARLREFLAAQRLGERMGAKVTELRSLPALDTQPPRGALVVPNRRQELAPPKIAELVRWAERGGHLIVEAEFLGVPDPLLDRLGVARSASESQRRPLEVEIPGAPKKLAVFFGDSMMLDAGANAADLRVIDRLASFRLGLGRATVATHLHFARNPSYYDEFARQTKRPARSIAAHDHAEFFWRLATLTPGLELQVYFRPERLSLWGFLKENAAPALAVAAVLLALWLWSIVPRFGPVAPDAPPGRRRLLDHLRASGRYYWTQGLRSRLVVATREAALRRIARAQPDFADAPQAERVSRLASLASITKQEAARFISAAGAMRGADFIRITQYAQRIHSALEKGAK
jgi:hypothetical protein